MARWLMVLGALLLVAGALLHFVPGSLNWFGKLPGDVRIETAQGKILIPVTSMIIVSVVLTLLVNFFKR